jgi:hypothetical protein
MSEYLPSAEEVTRGDIKSQEKIESKIEKVEKEIDGIKYVEYINIPSFSEAVDLIKKVAPYNSRIKSEKRGGKNYVVVDYDGTLKPEIKLLSNPSPIDKETSDSFTKLVNCFDGSVAIATNRNEKAPFFPNSPAVIKEIRDMTKKTGKNIPLFTGLLKQFPNLSKEDIGKDFKSERVVSPKIDALIHHIGKRISEGESKKITLYSIEDESWVSPNREDFLIHISKGLKEEYDIESDILNFVIKN